jgi:phosphoribosyl-AMP cyclohydrolase
MHYHSRSRNQLWLKGEQSGNFQQVRRLQADCDGDCLLADVRQFGPACHTGVRSCFFRPIEDLAHK